MSAAPSDRSFGLRAAWVAIVIGLSPLLRHRAVRWWALALAALVAVAALVSPRAVGPLRAGWARVTDLVGAIALGLAFFLVLTPTAWLLRRFGRDALRLQPRPEAATYWISRADRARPDSTRPF